MGAVYIPGTGIVITLREKSKSMRIVIMPGMTIAAIERHIKEVREWIA